MSSELRYTSAPERRDLLLRTVELQGFCSIGELATALGVSEMTVRRDTQRLEAQGRLRSVHGGATALPANALRGSAFAVRHDRMRAAKQAVARRAATMVAPGTSIALDAGTTMLQLAVHLRGQPVTVVTPSLPVMTTLLGDDRTEVVGLGGTLNHRSQSFAGPTTVRALEDLRVDTYFLATTGVDATGLYCGNDVDAVNKRALIAAADRVVLVCDSSKLTASAMVRICAHEQLDAVVVDADAAEAQLQWFADAGVEVTSPTPSAAEQLGDPEG